MSIATIEWKNSCMRIIDQTKLPLRLEYLECRDVKTVWKAIKELKVRGAPAIGIAGALGVALGMKDYTAGDIEGFKRKLDRTIEYLASSRPTAVNLFWALERKKRRAYSNLNLSLTKIKKALLDEALKILEEDKAI